jgi:hypothetical protein
MKSSTVVAIVLGVLLAFTGVGTAAGIIWSNKMADSGAPPKNLPSNWPTHNGELPNDVAMPTGQMVAALPTSTAGHVLCRALPQQRWEEILGGRALTEVQKPGTCHVVTDTLDVTVHLDQAQANAPAGDQVDVAGHQGTVARNPSPILADLSVRLVETPNTSPDVKPYLYVHILQDPNDRQKLPLDDHAVAIARDIVAATTGPGQDLPVQRRGTITAKAVDPVPGHGIAGAAWPAISWQMCTQLAHALDVRPASATARFRGECTVTSGRRSVTARYEESSAKNYPETIGGRPARVEAGVVQIKLTDDSDQELSLSGTGFDDPALRALAGTVVPPLVGR